MICIESPTVCDSTAVRDELGCPDGVLRVKVRPCHSTPVPTSVAEVPGADRLRTRCPRVEL